MIIIQQGEELGSTTAEARSCLRLRKRRGHKSMRYEKGHKDATRQRIIEVASRQFREQGVAAVGLAGIMADAGLTNGAFYAHFDSKEDLVSQVLSNAKRSEMWRVVEAGDGEIESAIRGYLSCDHRDNPGRGCPISALAAEIARHPKPTRQAFTGKVAKLIELIAARLGAGSKAERRRKPVAISGLMVGTLPLPPPLPHRRLSDEIFQ